MLFRLLYRQANIQNIPKCIFLEIYMENVINIGHLEKLSENKKKFETLNNCIFFNISRRNMKQVPF